MENKKIITKLFVNKRTHQLSATISKKKLKAIDPTLKPSDNLFIKLEVFKRKK